MARFKYLLVEMNSFPKYLTGIEYVIWDWNGTLLDDLHYTVSLLNKLLPIEQIGEISLERHKELFQFPIYNYYQTLGLKLQEAEFVQMCETFVSRYMENISHCNLVNGITDLLDTVKEAQVGQSILSAMDQENLSTLVSNYDIQSYFENIYGIADKLGASKVARGKELLKNLNLEPQKILLIGDTDHDLEVGQAMGVNVLLVSHGHQSFERLKKVHSHVLE